MRIGGRGYLRRGGRAKRQRVIRKWEKRGREGIRSEGFTGAEGIEDLMGSAKGCWFHGVSSLYLSVLFGFVYGLNELFHRSIDLSYM